MNVLFVYYLPSGGVETLNRQRSIALKRKNINCHFLYYRKERELINDHHAPTFITNHDNEISEILHKGNYNAVIITSDYLSLPKFRSLGYKGKLILEIQGLGSQERASAELNNAIPFVKNNSNGLLSSKTPHIMKLLNQIYPSFPKFIFHNCFDTTQFTYKPLKNMNNPIIAWIGRIDDNKNWREFLQIGHQLIKRYNSKIRLFMFEDHTLSLPSERQKFQKLIHDLNLRSNLTILSNIPHEQMANYFSIIGDSGGFLCSTSKVEGFGYAIIEAMSCRCPVLTTDSDGVKHSIIHNQTGKYYSLGNINQAVNEAIGLMTNTSLREQIRLNAVQHVKVHFDPEKYSENFINMLESL